ncbi:hypothetical protein [Amycolatopsis sp. 195334CR]|uniref:hypothetical protein n=1 Tax=Amycolatopsis sp. 195334CR TaxID=2814588 RepID=UPI001A8C8F50|nr:hypothetical protein [Amycolatopsis sp. 195334CR]MBN6039637.1 hypothetical protein [Amycolatopsis sp. 195334CR]
MRLFITLALAVWFAMHTRRGTGGTSAPGKKNSQVSGSVDASSSVELAQVKTGELGVKGRPTGPFARFPLSPTEAASLPQDARAWRRRDIPRIHEADQVRKDAAPGIRKALDDAVAEFLARSPDQAYTGGREKQLNGWIEQRDAATRRKHELQDLAKEGPLSEQQKKDLAEAKEEEGKLSKLIENAPPRLNGLEIHAIFERNINNRGAEILGPHAENYQLRAEAPYHIGGRGQHPENAPADLKMVYQRPDLVLERMSDGTAQYTAHTYDVKTGKAGITPEWEQKVERNARGLFQPEELRPTAQDRAELARMGKEIAAHANGRRVAP